MKEQFPLSDRFYEEDLLLKYMKSDITYLVLATEIEECFRNPHVFVDWIHDSRDPEKKLTRWLRDSGSALIEKMEGLRRTFEEVAAFEMGLGRSNKQIRKMLWDSIKNAEGRSRILRDHYSRKSKTIKHDGVSRLTWEKKVVDSSVNSIPSLDALFRALATYMIDNAVPSPVSRKLKRSDIADIFHMAYLPYVDAFRCDGSASTIAKSIAKPYGTKIISKFSDLPKFLDKTT